MAYSLKIKLMLHKVEPTLFLLLVDTTWNWLQKASELLTEKSQFLLSNAKHLKYLKIFLF